MRVLVVSSMYPSASRPGSGTFVRESVEAVASLGIEQHVIHPVPKRVATGLVGRLRRRKLERNSRQDGDAVSVVHVPYQHIPHKISTRLEVTLLGRSLSGAIAHEAKNKRVDLIHAHYLFPTGYVAVRIGASLGVPVICTAHGSDVHTNPYRNSGIRRFTSQTIAAADQLTAVSRALADDIPSLGTARRPVQVLYNGVDLERLASESDESRLRGLLGISKECLVIGTVGRVVEAKGVFELACAFRSLVASGRNAMLVVAGDGPDRSRLERWFEIEGLSDQVRFLGVVPHSDIARVFGSLDVFCLPSHKEGVPVSMLEAMACRVPVLVSAVGGIPEVVTDDLTGVLVPPRDSTVLEERLLRLASSRSLRKRLGSAAQERIRNGFLASQAAGRMVELYREVLSTRRAPAS